MSLIILALILANSLDLGTTEYAINHGLSEGNGLVGNRGVRIELKVASTGASIFTINKLEKHKTLKRIFTIVAIGVPVGASIINYRRIRLYGS
jgi:hypothetical protein